MHGGAHTYLLLGMPWSAVAAYNEYPLLHLDRSDQEGHQLQLLVGYLLECVCDGKSVHSSSGVACGVCNSAGDSVGAVHSSSHPHAVDRFSTNRAPHLQTPPALRCLSSNTTAFLHAVLSCTLRASQAALDLSTRTGPPSANFDAAVHHLLRVTPIAPSLGICFVVLHPCFQT